ncbi:MAG: Outer membrane lipoprotein omp16 precursor [uncultured Aureispira sp.]|uniref:Outer membrane lipoprotein omp16 n=1 Tax=uncultured Aureispira sp. TaxID=1331704 RepID=A0A6S6U481_9BACT|nr:MAG: Outer membrane lipoprotein omp16 precursor [uncultured Aureispira sp.]
MKYAVFIILLFFISTSLTAQINKGKKLVEKGDYEAAIEAFENDLEKVTSQSISLHELAKIYFTKRYDGYNIEKAYQYISRSIKEYKGLSKANKNKVQAKGLSILSLNKFQSNVVLAAFNVTVKSNELSRAERFLELYPTAGKQQVENMTKIRDELAFEKASKQNTFAAFDKFFSQHEITAERFNKDLFIRAQKKLLESYIKENGWQLYPSFEEKYIDNVYVKDSKAAYDLIKIVRKKSLKEYQEFTEAYPHSPFNKFAKDYMFDLIMAETNIADYDYFVRAYPNYEKKEEIWLRFYRLYLQEHGTNAATEFAEAYPNYPFQDAINSDVQGVQKKKDQPLFEKAKETEDILLILELIEKSPSSPYILELEATMYAALKKNALFRGCNKFLTLFPNSTYYDTVLDLLYDRYVSDGELGTINQFMMEHPEYKNIEKQQRDLNLANQGAKLNLLAVPTSENIKEYETYIRAAAPKERAFIALQRLIESAINDKNWTLALSRIEEFAPAFGKNNAKINALKQILATADVSIQKLALGGGINSSSPEYTPLLSIDNKNMYFCRLNKSSAGVVTEDIFVSTYKDQEWQMAKALDDINSPTQNEGLLAISVDEQEIIIFDGNTRNGDMLSSTYSKKGWSKPMPMPNTINTPSWDADGMISSDGNAFLYVSERKEVLDLEQAVVTNGFHGSNTGNRDIFVALKNKEGAWQEAINLGDAINTPFAERTPFLHPDMKTLYFSSDGHGGLGHLDVYMTTRLDDTWTKWSTPVNLGKSINTAQNDWGYRISTDGQTAYFSAITGDSEEDIFYIKLPRKYQPTSVNLLSGIVVDINNQPTEVDLAWEDLETGEIIGQLKNNPVTGTFILPLLKGKKYAYFGTKKNCLSVAQSVNLSTINGQQKIQVASIKALKEKAQSVTLYNVFFENQSAKLKKTSFPELNRLAKQILDYKLFITIIGESSLGGVSEQRVNAIKNYLVSKGCKESHITTGSVNTQQPFDNPNKESRSLIKFKINDYKELK